MIQPFITGMADYGQAGYGDPPQDRTLPGSGPVNDHGLPARFNDPDHPQWRQHVQEAAARTAAESPWEQVIAQAVALLSGPARPGRVAESQGNWPDPVVRSQPATGCLLRFRHDPPAPAPRRPQTG